MAHLDLLELLLRGAAFGGFLGLAIAIARGGSMRARWSGVLFCLAAASHTMTQLPALAPAFGPAWGLIWLLSVSGAGLFWMFAIELFEDRPGFEPQRLAPAAVLVAIGLMRFAVSDEAAKGLWLAHNLIGAALLAHVLFLVFAGWKNDLVEPRRRLRGPVLAAGAVYAMVVTLVQAGEVLWWRADTFSPLAAALLFAMSMAGMAAFLRSEPALFGDARGRANNIGVAPSDLDGGETRLAAVLDRLMREERLSREPGLTVARLAARAGVPEYRLRRLINHRLGHRNFNAYLNQWRLEEAKGALADPAQREVPVATIALDAGFQSLGPFNRAFRDATGLTPTAYRARALSSGTS